MTIQNPGKNSGQTSLKSTLSQWKLNILMMLFHKNSQELLLPVEHGGPVGDGDGQVLPDASVSVAGRHHHRLVVHVQGGGVIPAT